MGQPDNFPEERDAGFATGPDDLLGRLRSQVLAMTARRMVTQWQELLPADRPCYLCSSRDCDHIPRKAEREDPD
jgi:hypothetical protein